MNRTGLRNYLLHGAFDEELMALGRMWGEDNGYDHMEVWSDLHEYVEIAGWDAHETIDQLEGVDPDSDYFRLDGNGNLVGLTHEEHLSEIRADLDSIIDWCGDVTGAYYQQLPDAVAEFIDQDDPMEMLESLDFSYEDLGPHVGDDYTSAHHDYAVTLSSGEHSETFEFHCNPSAGMLPTKVDMVEAVFLDASSLRDYEDDMRSFAAANGFDYDEDQGVARAEALRDAIHESCAKLESLLGDYDLDVLDEFLSDVRCNRYPDVKWGNLRTLEKQGEATDLDAAGKEMAGSVAGRSQQEPSPDITLGGDER